MTREPKIWMAISVFQVLYGLAIFGLTRDYYLYGPDRSGARPPTVERSTSATQSALPPPAIRDAELPALSDAEATDPQAISRRADEYFARQDFERAADFYARSLALAPNDVDTHNNLGLTLHYLNRSEEALRTLNEGVSIDPEYQRIWLTLGYVNSQLGHTEQASKALTNATLVGDDQAIRKSAMEMLRDLP